MESISNTEQHPRGLSRGAERYRQPWNPDLVSHTICSCQAVAVPAHCSRQTTWVSDQKPSEQHNRQRRKYACGSTHCMVYPGLRKGESRAGALRAGALGETDLTVDIADSPSARRDQATRPRLGHRRYHQPAAAVSSRRGGARLAFDAPSVGGSCCSCASRSLAA